MSSTRHNKSASVGIADIIKIRRALISVSDKRGLVDFARALDSRDIEIISTGGTMTALRKAGVHVVSVSTFTGAPEILDGRVKTLHPKVHAGILYRRDLPDHLDELTEQEYRPIDLVVVNLYPFEETVATPGATEEDSIENIDIGGPSLIRGAAKNFTGVVVVTSFEQYQTIVDEMNAHDGGVTLATRRELAAAAFARTTTYDRAIADFFAGVRSTTSSDAMTGSTASEADSFPATIHLSLTKKSSLRYGENPHQKAAWYENRGVAPSLCQAEVLGGKELSYNNIADLDAALEMTLDFARPFAAIIKHANPCGAAESDTLVEAYANALACDPLSAFGSIIGLNRIVDSATAKLLHDTEFVECVLAPGYTPDALALLETKKQRRLLALPGMEKGRPTGETAGKFIRGGVLWQSADDARITASNVKVVTLKSPTAEQMQILLFAWRVVKHTKSNAIVIARDGAAVGIGMGQTSRVDSSFLAVKRAGERAKGAVLASDAFFPMPDGLEIAINAGVTAVIQPGGSKRDSDVIALADKAGIAMVTTGVRHFRH